MLTEKLRKNRTFLDKVKNSSLPRDILGIMSMTSFEDARRQANQNVKLFADEVRSIVLAELDSYKREMARKVDKIIEHLAKARGDKGDQGIEGRAGYTPQKGIDFFDGVDGKQGLKGAKGDNGYTPKKGIDYFTETEIEGVVRDVVRLIPVPSNGIDGSLDSGKDIVKKINELNIDGVKIDASHIKNLPEKIVEKVVERVSMRRAGGGGTTVVSDDLSSQCDGATLIFTTTKKIGFPIILSCTQFPTLLRPTTDYVVSGTTLTLSSSLIPPASGQSLVFVYSEG